MTAPVAPDLDERFVAFAGFEVMLDRIIGPLDGMMVDFGDHIALDADPLRRPVNPGEPR